ncbi:hypothetical protein KP509_23G043600 [Ceratopteris richardii]|uniref:Uncharacterized protein n=1 Tax=Ceratopteris richardii TaxID=49495 RepID=A0A8T2S1G9_CERRI|nr:hypothetical protein KP509_23G043600 [Ceratopteris richardii]
MDEPYVPECPICLQPYDESHVIPRVLFCGHSLCESCIVNLSHGDGCRRRLSLLRCPECIQPSKLQELPKNIELLRFIGHSGSIPGAARQTASRVRRECHLGKGPSFVYDASIAELCRWIVPPSSAEITHSHEGRVFLYRGDDMETVYSATILCVKEAREPKKNCLGWDYREKVKRSLEWLSGHELKDLLHLLTAQEEAFGIWMNNEDGPLYLAYKALSPCKQRTVAVLAEGIYINKCIELCEIFMKLHEERVVAGLLTPSCLGESEFMHIRLNVGGVLTNRKILPLSMRNILSELNSAPKENFTESDKTLPFFYASPELLLLLKKSEMSSKCEITCRTDSWTFACLFCQTFIGGTPWDGSTIEEFLQLSLHGTEHADSWIKGHIESNSFVSCDSIEEALRAIIKCFSYTPDDRPCISEIWHLLSCTKPSSNLSELRAKCCNAGIGVSTTLWCLALGCNVQTLTKVVNSGNHNSSVPSEEPSCISFLKLVQMTSGDDSSGSHKSATATLEGHLSDVTCLALCGQYLFSGSMDKTIHVWSLKDNTLIRIIKGHSQKVMALACYEHLSMLISGDYGGEIFVWGWDKELSDIHLIKQWHHHQDWRYSGVSSLAVSVDNFLYSGAGDKAIKVWSLEDYGMLETLEGHKAMVSVLLIDGEILFSGSWDGTVRLWWRSDHSPLVVLNESTQHGAVFSLTISAELILVGYQSGRIQVWKNEACINTIAAHDNTVSCLCLCGEKLYSGSWDGSIKEMFPAFDADLEEIFAANHSAFAYFCLVC